MTTQILLCTDLDRTVIPNGYAPESPAALQLFRELCGDPRVTLAYISGRNRELLELAINQYNLPVPEYAVGDVGTSIYQLGPKSNSSFEIQAPAWVSSTEWSVEISKDWPVITAGITTGSNQHHLEMVKVFADVSELILQEPENQGPCKLSYYAPAEFNFNAREQEFSQGLAQAGFNSALIYSIDEEKNVGLLDVIPARATKLHAAEFIGKLIGFSSAQLVFAGDSGNDLPALTSGLKAILVANARQEIREQAMRTLSDKGLSERLYCASGNFKGLNGNYSAGVVEGVYHFFPELLPG